MAAQVNCLRQTSLISKNVIWYQFVHRQQGAIHARHLQGKG